MASVVTSGVVEEFSPFSEGLPRPLTKHARKRDVDPGAPGPADSPEVELTVVVPFYNPGKAVIRETVATAIAVLTGAGITFEILAVSDGSSDGSAEALESLLSDSVHCLVLPANGGKGRAVRVGLERGRGEYLGFIDGDGDIPPDLLVSFMALARELRPAAIVGSKRHPDSRIDYPPLRRLYSWGYQSMVRLLFGLDVRDTQVGIKLFRRDVALEVLPMMSEDRFAFDLELLALTRRLGYDHICEAPVRINARKGSTVSPKAVFSMIRDTLGIFWRLRVRRLPTREPSLRDGTPVAVSALAEEILTAGSISSTLTLG